MSTQKVLCTVCNLKASLMCQRCGEPYCNDVCQRKDWFKHKHYCNIMPYPSRSSSLVSLTANERGPPGKQNISSSPAAAGIIEPNVPTLANVNSPSNNNKTGATEELSNMWRTHVVPSKNDFFDCRVTFIEGDGSIWVVALDNTERLERLTENIRRYVETKKPCKLQDLSMNDLVCVTVGNKSYRGEVLAIDANAGQADVRLVDYGVVTKCVQNIYLAMRRLYEVKAFALRVKLSLSVRVHIDKVISLRLQSTKTSDGIYRAQLKEVSNPLDLPLQILNSTPNVSIVTIFKSDAALKEPEVALIKLKALDDLNVSLSVNQDLEFTKPFPEDIPPIMVAAKTKEGYQRALLLDNIDQPTLYLVYEIDVGRISIVENVASIHPILLTQPPRVFAVTIEDDIRSFQQQIKQSRHLCIKFSIPYTEDNSRTLPAKIMLGNQLVCGVKATSFMGRMPELGHKYWRESIENGSLVYITHIIDYKEICFNSVKTKQYANLFKALEPKCQPFYRFTDISIGSIVFVVCRAKGNYRAEVTDTKGDQYTVFNIDTGSTYEVPIEMLRSACNFIKYLPVNLGRAKIKTICSIPPIAVPSNPVGLQLLAKYYVQKSELTVEFSDDGCIDLLDFTAEPKSLMTRLLPLVFTPAAVELEPAKNLPEIKATVPAPDKVVKNLPAVQATVPEPDKVGNPDKSLTIPTYSPKPLLLTPSNISSTPKGIKRTYISDVDRQLIPLGQNMQIMILNCVDLHKTGFFTACYFPCEKVAENFQNLIDLVAEIGADDKLLPGYKPEVNELCLARFTDDSWNRAVCYESNDQCAHILYCDFGNIDIVPLNQVKKIPDRLLSTIYATKCFLEGFDKSLDFLGIEKYLGIKGIVQCTVLAGKEEDTRIIHIPYLDKLMSEE